MNFDLEPQQMREKQRHHWLLPGSICCVVIGSRRVARKVLVLVRQGCCVRSGGGKEVASFHSNSDDIIPVEIFNLKERSVIVFDDVILEKEGPIEKYFTRGRHGNADCFYLTQNYFRIPKQAIRDNAKFIIIFAQDGKNVRAIHDSFGLVV